LRGGHTRLQSPCSAALHITQHSPTRTPGSTPTTDRSRVGAAALLRELSPVSSQFSDASGGLRRTDRDAPDRPDGAHNPKVDTNNGQETRKGPIRGTVPGGREHETRRQVALQGTYPHHERDSADSIDGDLTSQAAWDSGSLPFLRPMRRITSRVALSEIACTENTHCEQWPKFRTMSSIMVTIVKRRSYCGE